jgi:hypothetical protein
MRAEPTDIEHNMFGQIKKEIPWYSSRHGIPKMMSGQFVAPTQRLSSCASNPQ